MSKVIFVILSISFTLLMFTGCQGTPTLNKNWGAAVESSKYNQILNPEAGKNTAPVEYMNGQVAEKNIEKYKKSFEKEIKQERYPLGLLVGK